MVFISSFIEKRWKRLKLEKCWNKNKTCHEEIMKTELMD